MGGAHYCQRGGVGILSTVIHLGRLSTPKSDVVQLSTIKSHDGIISMLMKEHCQLRKSVMEYCQLSQLDTMCNHK